MLSMRSYCQGSKQGCISCCGIFNLSMEEEEKKKWLKKNTQEFLSLRSIEEIFLFRKRKEEEIKPYKIFPSIYVCPFMGYIEGERVGCLLHPLGSPHPMIRKLFHPQNFSFYGEGICQGYNCPSKEKNGAPSWIEELLDPLEYSFFISHKILWDLVEKIEKRYPHFSKILFPYWKRLIKKEKLPHTSFERLSVSIKEEEDFLFSLLGSIFTREAYEEGGLLSLTLRGKRRGKAFFRIYQKKYAFKIFI